jgi:uncharacterized Zn finger protein (UPF0148 family)
LLLLQPDLLARAGGAGGSSGGSGGGGGGEAIYLVFILIRVIATLPFPLNIIVALLIIGGFFGFSYLTRRKVRQKSILNRIPAEEPAGKVKGYDTFIRNNPGFDEAEFREKVKTAFIQIQDAWEKQDLSRVRKYISDGVYQRFNTQFRMMKLLKQTNRLENLEVKGIHLDRIDTDGLYDIIHVAIHASIIDHFESELDPSLNSGGKEEFVEYWSFLKKRGAEKKDLYGTNQCPNCGAPLPEKMGEVSNCESCGTLTNSGEYDWVLSEITQADDYVSTDHRLRKSGNLTDKIRKLINENEDFSVQLMEDKASNGYLQIITAKALNDPSIMRRFVSDELFGKIEMPGRGAQISYNRIYLNDVYLVGVSEEADLDVLHIAVRSSFQRVKIEGETVTKLDPVVISRSEVLLMSRSKNAGKPKGSLYMHNCPSCGAPVENSLQVECNYCGAVLNSPENEWIITGLMSFQEYENYRSTHRETMPYSVSPSLTDRLYDVRDYAFNNVMIVLAADGVFAEKEKEFSEKLAKQWGYKPEKIQGFLNMAESGQLAVKMPEDHRKQRKIYRLMEKAAEADDEVSRQELELLEQIRKEFNIRKAG